MTVMSKPKRPELIIVKDFRYLDAKGKQWPEGGGREVFKIRRYKAGSIPVRDRFNKMIDEVAMRGGYYDDLPVNKLYDSEEEAQIAMRQMS